MIWHPHLWREIMFMDRHIVRGAIGPFRPRKDSQSVFLAALEDAYAGGPYRADPAKRVVGHVVGERCVLCGAERVRVDLRWRIEDDVLTDDQMAAWARIARLRVDGAIYNGVLANYGMSIDAIHLRADPRAERTVDHIVSESV